MRKHILIAMTAIMVLALATVAMAGDPSVGTWKLNLTKSKFSDPGSASKSITTKVETQENGMLKCVMNIVAFDGNAIQIQFAYKRDGKDYPTTGDPSSDAVAFRQIASDTYNYIVKKDGKQVKSGRIVISKDGKTMTQSHKEKNQKRQDTNSTLVFDKQ